MRRPGGAAIWTDRASGREVHRDTTTCCHCNAVTIVDPKDPSTLGGFCRLCMRNTCGPCADAGKCTPFERKLELAERRDRFRALIDEGG